MVYVHNQLCTWLISSLFGLSISLVMTCSVYAFPKNKEVPEVLRALKADELTPSASSVGKGYSINNLLKKQAWRAWGSMRGDRLGSWIHFRFNRLHYVDLIYFVPGDEREIGYYKKCGRPAKIEISTSSGIAKVLTLP